MNTIAVQMIDNTVSSSWWKELVFRQWGTLSALGYGYDL